MTAPYTELEKPLDEYSTLCRGCLAESGEMKNIFEWGLADDFCKITEIQLQQSEGISQLLCVSCEDALLTCRRFRQQCQTSDLLLRNTAKKKPEEPSQEHQKQQENTISSVLYDKKLVLMITAPDTFAKIYLSCPYCTESYMKQKDLLIHLRKNHKMNDEFVIEVQYYCSVKDCKYFINSGKNKHFLGRKFLNQHYNKVHTDKNYNCDTCLQKFSTNTDYERHYDTCNVTYICQVCDLHYKTNEKLLVHLMRKHPDLHKQYKADKRALKRKSRTVIEPKKLKTDDKINEFICDSPKRSFATQTFQPEDNIKNDVTLPSWHSIPTKTDEISTQTVFEDLLSLKSQTSEDESIFFSETVSLSDIQTQTFPVEFGLSRSNKKTITSETQSPDLSIKETQTCFCLLDSPKLNYRLFDSVTSSPSSINLTSTETQTAELKSNVKSDVLLSFNSAQTQTSFEEGRDNL